MEKMLNDYLQFSKSGANEKTEKFNISELTKSIVKKYNNKIFYLKQITKYILQVEKFDSEMSS